MYQSGKRGYAARGGRDRSSVTKLIGRTVGVILALTAPAALANDKPSELREITVGVPSFFPPYYQLDASGNAAGFAIDVMEAVAARAGVTARYRIFQIDRERLAALRDGTIDVLPSIGVSEGRQTEFDFTNPVDTFKISLFIRKETIDVEGLEDLVGRSVGAVVPNLAHRMLRERKDIKLESFGDFPTALFALLSGRIDALAYPAPVAWKFARDAGIGDRIKVTRKPIAENQRAMAVRKGNTELLAILDSAVREFIASQEYRRIYATWFSAPAVFWTVAKIIWAVVALVLALLIALAWWRYYSSGGLNRGSLDSISEREETEGEKERQRLLLESIVENIPAHVTIRDKENRFVFVNQRNASFMGMSVEEFLSKTPMEVFGSRASTRNLIDDLIQKVRETGVPVFGFEHPDFVDGKILFSTDILPIRDLDGNVEEILSIRSDITERRETEEALRESEERYRLLFEHAPDAVMVHRNEIMFANTAAVQMYRAASADELMVVDRIELVHPDDRAIIRERREMLHDGVRLPPIRITGLRLDGSEFPCEFRGSVFSLDGEPAWLLVVRDLTERDQAEEEKERQRLLLKSVVDNIPAFVSIRDREGQFHFVNQAFADRAGLTVEEVVGKTTNDLFDFSSSISKSYQNQVHKVFETGEPVLGLEYPEQFEHTKQDDSRILLSTNISPIRGLDGKVDRILTLRFDITERKEAEVEKERQRLLLESIVENIPANVGIRDREDRFVFVNQRASDFAGRPVEEFIGKTWVELFGSAVMTSFACKLHE